MAREKETAALVAPAVTASQFRYTMGAVTFLIILNFVMIIAAVAIGLQIKSEVDAVASEVDGVVTMMTTVQESLDALTSGGGSGGGPSGGGPSN